MHIAVCDDIVVERKQLERLLAREADKRRGDISGLYVDSFGSIASLMTAVLTYDAYFIDFNSEGKTGIDVANALLEAGKTSVIIMCCGNINYRLHQFPDNVIFIDKPIKVEELSNVINHVEEILDKAEPTIEIREENGNTFRIKEAEFIYSEYSKQHVYITMSEGRKATILSSFDHFYNQLQNYENLVAINSHTMINAHHIVHLDGFHVTMPGSVVFRVSPFYRNYARYIYSQTNRTNQ